MVAVQHWFTLLISQWLIALPWLMLGVTVATGLFLFTPREFWERRLPRSPWLKFLVGIGLGLLLPVGQIGALPVTKRLLWDSAAPGMAIAFWLTATSLNPFLLWQIWQSLPDNHDVALFHAGLSFFIIWAIAGLFSLQRQQITHVHTGDEVEFKYPALVRPSAYRTAIAPLETNTLVTNSKLNFFPVARKTRLSVGFYHLTRELIEWSCWLLIGSLCSATLNHFLAPQLMGNHINQWTAYSTGFFSPSGLFPQVSLASHWLIESSAACSIAFLLSSSFLNLQSIALMGNTFRPKSLGYLLTLLVLLTLFFSLWLSFHVF
jgi:uncharacterized protein